MSTRWYPLYQKGNPQLRIFLPNFWLKLVQPEHKQPKNVVQFHCSMEMTKHDVQNYLEKIYNVKTILVRTRIALGKTRQLNTFKYVVKDNDIKIAYVVLEKNQTFEFPDLFPKNKDTEENEVFKQKQKEMLEYVDSSKEPGAPEWYRI